MMLNARPCSRIQLEMQLPPNFKDSIGPRERAPKFQGFIRNFKRLPAVPVYKIKERSYSLIDSGSLVASYRGLDEGAQRKGCGLGLISKCLFSEFLEIQKAKRTAKAMRSL
jgi:hypothetical protein